MSDILLVILVFRQKKQLSDNCLTSGMSDKWVSDKWDSSRYPPLYLVFQLTSYGVGKTTKSIFKSVKIFNKYQYNRLRIDSQVKSLLIRLKRSFFASVQTKQLSPYAGDSIPYSFRCVKASPSQNNNKRKPNRYGKKRESGNLVTKLKIEKSDEK